MVKRTKWDTRTTFDKNDALSHVQAPKDGLCILRCATGHIPH